MGIQELRAKYGANNQQPNITPAVQTPVSGLDKLRQKYATPNTQKIERPFTVGERVAQVGHGAATTYGSIPDLIGKYSARALETPSLMESAGPYNPEEYEGRGEPLRHFGLAEKAGNKVSELTGRELTPSATDTTGKLLHTFGGFAAPLPIPGAGQAAKLGTKIAEHAIPAAGASAAINLTPSFTEEGTIGRGVEDLAKAIVGGRASTVGVGKASKLAQNIQKMASEKRLIKEAKDLPVKAAGKVLSIGTNPDAKALINAEKHGIELPFNVGLGGKTQNFLANNYLKSIFASDAYKKVYQNADEAMINKVKHSIENIGGPALKPGEASSEFRQYIKNDEKAFKKQSDALYEEAQSKLGPNDVIVPKNTINSIESMRELLNRDIKSPATKKVAGVIGQLAEKWGITKDIPKLPHGITEEYIQKNPQVMNQILDSFQSGTKAIPIEKLNGIRKELGQMIDYDPDVRGVEAYLSRLRKDITKDIESSPNKEFISKWKESNDFFRQNIAERFRTDMAHSLMTGEAPTEAIRYLDSVDNINLLEKIAGESPKGKDIFNSLKQAKAREIIEKSTVGGGLESGSISAAQFSKLFTKGEKKQEVLERLLGKKNYDSLAEIGQISEAYSKAGKDLLNTSGTAIASSDINKAEQLVKSTLGTLFGSSAGYAAAGLPGAAVGVAMPNLLSRIVSNPKIVNQARLYALQRKNGHEKQAQSLLNRLISSIKKEQKTATIQTVKTLSSDKKEEK